MPQVFSRGLFYAMTSAALSALSFMFAKHFSNPFDLMGHFLKLSSYLFIYQTLVAAGLAARLPRLWRKY